MPLTTQAVALPQNDIARLQPRLEKQLSEYFGKQRVLRTIDRRLCPYMSSFRIDEIDVRFNDGSQLQLVLKDLGWEAMVDDARRARPEFLYEPRREIRAYQWILPHAPAGTARWYGAVTQNPAGRHWLLLERVRGKPLWQVDGMQIWEQTAGWIARFHATFSPILARQLATRSGALVYDEDFYWRWLDRAQRFGHRDTEWRHVLQFVARRYAFVVERLTGLPQTLVHGEFYPSNVIIAGHASVRVCPVDWEMTAIGPAPIDIAALCTGWSEPTQHALARAYLAAGDGGPGNGAAARRGARLPREFMVDLDCCRLHLAVRMLGWSDNWKPPQDHAHDWLEEAARVSRRLPH